MDTAVISKGVPELLDKGLLGLAVLALSCVVVYLYMDGHKLRQEITALAKETASGLAASSGTTAAHATEVAKLSAMMQQVLNSAQIVQSGIEGLARQSESNGTRIDRIFDGLARGAHR